MTFGSNRSNDFSAQSESYRVQPLLLANMQ